MKPFSCVDNGACPSPLGFIPLTLYQTLPEHAYLCELFCQTVIQLSLTHVNHTVKVQEKFHGFRIEPQKAERNKPSLVFFN